MATSREFAEYVTEQLQDAGRITCRRMFGAELTLAAYEEEAACGAAVSGAMVGKGI